MNEYYVIVNDDKIFSGMNLSGRLLWEEYDSIEPIQVVLFPTECKERIPGLPNTAYKMRVDELKLLIKSKEKCYM